MLLTARAASLLAAISLFMLQPLVARALVPLYGGTSWIWIAVSVFFQLSLILGYAAATRLSVAARARLHARIAPIALTLAATGLWILFQRVTLDRVPIEIAVFLHLIVTVGAIAIYLAMASPLLQIAIEGDGRIDAHRLYAWSNAGSLAGLIVYPTIMETFVPLRYQMVIWFALAAAAALLIHRTIGHTQASAGPQRIEWRFPGRGRVMFISAVAGALTIAVTARLTLDIGALPLLWVLPLIVLLLSYIVAFGNMRAQRSLSAAAPMALAITCYLFFNGTYMAPLEMVVLWCGLMFVIQCGLQTRLRALAPSGAARGSFYVSLAVGGFVGSLLVGCFVPYAWNTAALLTAAPLAGPVLRPLLQTDPIPELGWCLAAAAFALTRTDRVRPRDLVLAGGIGIVVVLLVVNEAPLLKWFAFATAAGAFAGAMAIAYLPTMVGRPWLFPITVLLIVTVTSLVPHVYGVELFRTRNVYGVLIAKESTDGSFTELYHGSTVHGMQHSERTQTGEVSPVAPQTALTYYHSGSPVGQIFSTLNASGCALHVGIVGLGAGTLAAYAKPGDEFEFFEIDPGVVSAALGPHFSYIAAARERGAHVTLVEGDGRRSLAQRVGQKLDLLIVDAFSSDSIPAHLLTIEAFETAQRQLAPGGHIAFHTSNRYFAVDRVVAANAEQLGWKHQFRSGPADELGTAGSDWVIVRPPGSAAPGACAVELLTGASQRASARPVWTDDFSNPLGLIKAAGLWSQLSGTRRPTPGFNVTQRRPRMPSGRRPAQGQ
jgi:hypothetical protein